MVRTLPRWTQRVTVVGLLVALVALLSGCVQTTQKSVIAPDLTGSTTLRIGVSKAGLMQISDLASANGFGPSSTPDAGASGANGAMGPSGSDITDMVQQINDQISQLGGTAMPFDDGDYVGVDILFNFTSLDQMTQQLNGVLGGTSGLGAEATQVSGQSGIATFTASMLSDGGVRVDGNVDPLSFLSDPNNPISSYSPDLAQAITSDPNAKVTIAFQMPGAIRTADAAAQQNGTTATWTFPIGSAPATIYVESDPR